MFAASSYHLAKLLNTQHRTFVQLLHHFGQVIGQFLWVEESQKRGHIYVLSPSLGGDQLHSHVEERKDFFKLIPGFSHEDKTMSNYFLGFFSISEERVEMIDNV